MRKLCFLGSASYFYPRPPRGERPTFAASAALPEMISIHALREESDWTLTLSTSARQDFYPRPPRGERLEDVIGVDGGRRISIHALREESDCEMRELKTEDYQFLSTPSARRATLMVSSIG